MKEIIDYIYESEFDSIVINETFQSTWLSSLAKKIKDSESKRHKSKNGYEEKREKRTSSFSNIFQTVFKDSNNNNPINIKWTDVKDDDFVLYKPKDKSFKKLCDNIFDKKLAKNKMALIISCEPDTKNIVYFTNAINGKYYQDNWSEVSGPAICQFDVPYSYWEGSNRGIDKKVATVRKSSRGYNNYRTLNQREAYDLLKNMDNYLLEIDDKLIEDYQKITLDRKEARKGTINFDKDSLDDILRAQRERYRAFVRTVKVNKMRSDDKVVYEEIKKMYAEIIELNEKIMKESDNWDLFSAMENLLRDFSYAFYHYYRYFIKNKRAQAGEESKFYKSAADEELIDVQKTLKKYRAEIDKIKAMM